MSGALRASIAAALWLAGPLGLAALLVGSEPAAQQTSGPKLSENLDQAVVEMLVKLDWRNRSADRPRSCVAHCTRSGRHAGTLRLLHRQERRGDDPGERAETRSAAALRRAREEAAPRRPPELAVRSSDGGARRRLARRGSARRALGGGSLARRDRQGGCSPGIFRILDAVDRVHLQRPFVRETLDAAIAAIVARDQDPTPCSARSSMLSIPHSSESRERPRPRRERAELPAPRRPRRALALSRRVRAAGSERARPSPARSTPLDLRAGVAPIARVSRPARRALGRARPRALAGRGLARRHDRAAGERGRRSGARAPERPAGRSAGSRPAGIARAGGAGSAINRAGTEMRSRQRWTLSPRRSPRA